MKKVLLMLVAVATFALVSCSGNAKDSDSASKKSDVKAEKVEKQDAPKTAQDYFDGVINILSTAKSGDDLKEQFKAFLGGMVPALAADKEAAQKFSEDFEKLADNPELQKKAEDALKSNPNITEDDAKEAMENAMMELGKALMP